MIYGIKSNLFLKINHLINFKEDEIYLSLDLIEKYAYKWNYWDLSENPNITEEFILKHPYKNWNIEYLIENNKITNFNALSKFKNMHYYFIDNYPNKPWDWEWLIQNTSITLESHIPLNLIKKYLYKWNYYHLSLNPNLTEDFILKYPHQKWNIKYLIDNNKITDFKALSKFKKINKYIIDEYQNKPWDWEWIIQNIDIDAEIYIPFNLIEKYSYKWGYYCLNKNPNFIDEFILKYPYQNWNIKYLIKKFFYKIKIYQ